MTDDASMPDTPFSEARRAYAGFVGSALAERDLWRRLFYASGAIILALMGALAWMYTRPTLVPYVTVIASDGREIQSAAASRYEPSEAIWRDIARHWIQMVRRVGHDPFVMEQDIRWAYERTSGPARSKLNTYFLDRGGLTPIDKKTRSIDGLVVIKQSAASFQVDWNETLYTQHGERTGTERWRALVTLEHHLPTSDAEIRRNGLGIYVVDFEWQRV